ncbi:hypothetical protein [Polynucleobacter asymbioticus]|uniref:hypothetical protein n=1 Tax=Polynucleobacter asymbioticus TaxID=576611 RepID=UPI0011606414|nr:hypothetical protein [Polynucleobacter asymbioticus]
MSRTMRRKNERYEYTWVLKDWDLYIKCGIRVQHDSRSSAGRKAIAIFHSDKQVTMGTSAPRWYKRLYDRRRRTRNNRVMKHWLDGKDFDPLFEARHRHEANWSWW